MPLVSSIDPIKVLRRHMWTIIGAGFIGGVLGVAAYFILLKLVPLYKGQVLFEVRPGLTSSDQVGSQEFNRDELVTRISTTETVILTSRPVLDVAARNQEILSTFWHRGYILPDGTFSVDDAVDDLEGSIKAVPMRGTNLFSLSWATSNKNDVPIVLNKIAEAYINRRESTDNATYTTNLEAFRSQLAQTNRELEDLTSAIKAYIQEEGITTLDDVRFSQASFKMKELTDKRSDAIQSLTLAQTSFMQAANKIEGTIEPTSEDQLQAEHDPSVHSHMQLMLSYKTELRRLMERGVNPDHHSVKDIEQRLSAVELERDAKIDEIMARNLQARSKELKDEIERLQRLISSTEEHAEATDQELRELAAAHSYFDALQKKREHLEVRRDSELALIKEVQLLRLRADHSRVRLVRPAETPREVSFPKKEIVIPLGGLALMGMAVGIVFLRELTDQRVKSGSDVAVIPGANVLGVIPELDEDPTKTDSAELVVRRHPNSVVAESYRQVCTPITRMMQRSGYQLLLLVGGLPGSGTTTVVTNLAAVASASGKRVVVIDANFRRPRLAAAFGADEEAFGLGDLLAGDATLDEAIQNTEYGVHVIHAGTPANRLFERLNHEKHDALIAELRTRYDLVLFDAPPAVVSGDAMVLASRVDAAVLVIRANQEHRGLVARLLRQLNDARCNPLGILLNRPRGTVDGYFKKNYATMAEYTSKPPKK
jgi:capsular exopolysaccharide synthesis family protein